MVKDFLHGVDVSQATVIQPATDVNMSTIDVIGIAPYADPEKWPLDTPILVTGSDTQLIGALTASAPADATDTGTLPAAFATMLDECSPVVVAIRVDGKTSGDAATIPNITGGIDSHGTYRGVHAFLVTEAITGIKTCFCFLGIIKPVLFSGWKCEFWNRLKDGRLWPALQVEFFSDDGDCCFCTEPS